MVSLTPFHGREHWGVHNNSYTNLVRAISERVFTVELGGQQVVPPQPAPGAVMAGLKVFKSRLVRAVGVVTPISTEQFVDTYVGRKRRLYECAAKSLGVKPLAVNDAYITAFIKDEKTNFTRKDDPCPRIIQPRSPRYNVCIGRHLKPMEKKIFNGISEVFGGVTVMKGLNAMERGYQLYRKWRRFSKPIAIMMDAKRFDQHCNLQVIKWEHSLWESLTAEPVELKWLNSMRRTNVCYARAHDADIKYKVRGGRMSGDMDTALGNCTTMCGMTWSFMRFLGVTKYEYMNDGDDGVLIVEEVEKSAVLVNFESFFLKFGFTMKLEGVTDIMEEVEFCQARPVFDGKYWRMVRDPIICLAKDSFTLKRAMTYEEQRIYSNAIGWCGLSLAGDMPIFGAFYRSMISLEKPENIEILTGMQLLAKRMEPKFSEPTDEARVSFWRAFRLSPDKQLALETLIRETPFSLGIPSPTAKLYADLLGFDLREYIDSE